MSEGVAGSGFPDPEPELQPVAAAEEPQQQEAGSTTAELQQRHCDSGLLADDGAFALGTFVVVAGLQAQADLNGRWGVIRGYNLAKGRYKVAIEGRERPAALRPANVYIQSVPAGTHLGTGGDFVIDISPFMEGCAAAADEGARRRTAAQWDATFRTVGFARIVGHGVSAEVIADLRSVAKSFFDRPEPEKLGYHRPAQPGERGISIFCVRSMLTRICRCAACSCHDGNAWTGAVHHGSYAPMFAGRRYGAQDDDPVEGYSFMRAFEGVTAGSPSLPPRASARTHRRQLPLEPLWLTRRSSTGVLACGSSWCSRDRAVVLRPPPPPPRACAGLAVRQQVSAGPSALTRPRLRRRRSATAPRCGG
jgi:hypothetical protein